MLIRKLLNLCTKLALQFIYFRLKLAELINNASRMHFGHN